MVYFQLQHLFGYEHDVTYMYDADDMGIKVVGHKRHIGFIIMKGFENDIWKRNYIISLHG